MTAYGLGATRCRPRGSLGCPVTRGLTGSPRVPRAMTAPQARSKGTSPPLRLPCLICGRPVERDSEPLQRGVPHCHGPGGMAAGGGRGALEPGSAAIGSVFTGETLDRRSVHGSPGLSGELRSRRGNILPHHRQRRLRAHSNAKTSKPRREGGVCRRTGSENRKRSGQGGDDYSAAAWAAWWSTWAFSRACRKASAMTSKVFFASERATASSCSTECSRRRMTKS